MSRGDDYSGTGIQTSTIKLAMAGGYLLGVMLLVSFIVRLMFYIVRTCGVLDNL